MTPDPQPEFTAITDDAANVFTVFCEYGDVGTKIAELQREKGVRVTALSQAEHGWLLTVVRGWPETPKEMKGK